MLAFNLNVASCCEIRTYVYIGPVLLKSITIDSIPKFASQILSL